MLLAPFCLPHADHVKMARWNLPLATTTRQSLPEFCCEAQRMHPLSLLLVDDEPEFIQPLAERISHRGLRAECCFSGTEALSRLGQAKDIDIVLLDVAMPEPDGLATVRMIKEQHPLVEVIMLTGQATVQSAVEAIKLGAYDYLTKPCDMNALIAAAEQAGARKYAREMKILDIRMQPYLTDHERQEQLRQVLNG